MRVQTYKQVAIENTTILFNEQAQIRAYSLASACQFE